MPREPQKKRRPRQTTPTKGNSSPPRTVDQYNAKSEKFKGIWDRVVSVISKMRSENASLQRASQEQGISPRTIKRWAGSALRKRTNGKWAPKKSDRLLRILMIPTSEGPREVGVRGSKAASQLGEYWNALQKYLETDDASGLKKFEGKFITDASGKEIPLLTDLNELNRLGSAGVLSFESLYPRS